MRSFGTMAVGMVMIAFSQAASAATVGVVTESAARFRRMETSTTYERDLRSPALRVGKTAVATLQPVGLVVAPVPSVGLGLGYFIDADSIVQVEGSYGRLRPDNLVDVNVGTVALNLKHFVGETFYLKGGAAYRETVLSHLSCGGCTTADVSREWGTARTIDSEFAIGNQWQWNHLTVGADWIGVLVPTIRLADSDITDAFGVSSNEVKRTADLWELLARTAGVSVARVYVGASF